MKRILIGALVLSACVSEQPGQSSPDTDAGVPGSDAGGTLSDSGPVVAPLTWHKDVRALVEERCSGCHSEGQIGPFNLVDYASVYAVRDAVASSVQSGSMPPWQAAKGCNDYDGDTR
jgi:hypothetical protein